MKTYSISAGYHDSILDIRQERTGHATVADALAALGCVAGDGLITYRGDDERIYVYRSQADMDADSDGSSALACILHDDDGDNS